MKNVRIRFYALRVFTGKISIEDVPEEYRVDVIAYLENM